MNKKRREEITRRKHALIIKAAQERSELTDAGERLRASVDLSQTVHGIGKKLKAHPMIMAGVSSMLVSGIAGKMLRGAGQVAKLGRVALPLWSWWKTRRRPA